MRIEDAEGIPFLVQKFHLEHLILCYKDISYSRGRLAAMTIPLSYHTNIQKGIGRTFQKSAKRMKASLGVLPSTPVAFLQDLPEREEYVGVSGVLPSTPVAFLQAEGRSLPARARLEKRQAAFVIRLARPPADPMQRCCAERQD